MRLCAWSVTPCRGGRVRGDGRVVRVAGGHGAGAVRAGRRLLPPARRGPAGHFRTSVHASPLFAGAVAAAAAPGRRGARSSGRAGAGRHGRGARRAADRCAGRAARRRWPRGCGRTPSSGRRARRASTRGSSGGRAARPGVTGLLFANEWLDNVPVEVAEADADGRAAPGRSYGGRRHRAAGRAGRPARTRSGWRGGGRWRAPSRGCGPRSAARGTRPGRRPCAYAASRARGRRRLRAHARRAAALRHAHRLPGRAAR